MTPEQLQAFEQEIADIYATGAIRAPVHLRGSEDFAYERGMIDALKINYYDVIRKQDWLFGFWDMHIPCLLKGVPPEELKAEILKGNSIALCFPEHRIYCSGIVGSLFGVAVGVAYSIKEQKKDEFVFICCGDMSIQTGIAFESVCYAANHDLPIKFIVSDNGLSVMTDTAKTWGNPVKHWYSKIWLNNSMIQHFKYKNKWPHSGLNERIKF